MQGVPDRRREPQAPQEQYILTYKAKVDLPGESNEPDRSGDCRFAAVCSASAPRVAMTSPGARFPFARPPALLAFRRRLTSSPSATVPG
jgi:hypothetical protein